MTKTFHGTVRALAAVVVLAAGAGLLSGCELFNPMPRSSSSFPYTASWDENTGTFITRRRTFGGGGDGGDGDS